MAGNGNRVYGFYNKTCGLGPKYFGDYLVRYVSQKK